MSTPVYLISMCTLFGTILVIFGLKYWSAAAAASIQAAGTDVYRKLAADAVTTQAGNAATLSAIQSEIAEIRARIAGVETILKTVG